MAEDLDKDLQEEESRAEEAPEAAEAAAETATEEAAETETEEAAETEKEETAEADPEAEEPAEETPEKTPEEEKAGQQKEKKSFFDKLKKDKKDPRDEKIAELTDRYQRLFAEFDNYRKRTEKEKSARYDMGVSVTLEKMLPVVDNFERGLAAIPEDRKEDPLAAGMDKIYKQMIKALTDMGVEPMNAEGKEFDPNLHNAVMQVENDELESNTVAAELQKGYTYKGNVLRHAMVSVVQ